MFPSGWRSPPVFDFLSRGTRNLALVDRGQHVNRCQAHEKRQRKKKERGNRKLLAPISADTGHPASTVHGCISGCLWPVIPASALAVAFSPKIPNQHSNLTAPCIATVTWRHVRSSSHPCCHLHWGSHSRFLPLLRRPQHASMCLSCFCSSCSTTFSSEEYYRLHWCPWYHL